MAASPPKSKNRTTRDESAAQTPQRELLAMFNRAAEDVTEEDCAERRLFMQAHPNRG